LKNNRSGYCGFGNNKNSQESYPYRQAVATVDAREITRAEDNFFGAFLARYRYDFPPRPIIWPYFSSEAGSARFSVPSARKSFG
jgi:hypothetical protein